MPKSLSIVGAGRVGRALGRRLRELGWRIGAVCANAESSARKSRAVYRRGKSLVGVDGTGACEQAGLADRARRRDCRQSPMRLPNRRASEWRGKIVLAHQRCVGSCSAFAFEIARALPWGRCIPLQTFSGVGVPPLEGRVFAIEGDEAPRYCRAQHCAGTGGIPAKSDGGKEGRCITPQARLRRDISWRMEEAGVQMLMSTGIKRAQATSALLSLSRQVLENYEKLGAHNAWTGPLSRGDYGVVALHEEAATRTPAGVSGNVRGGEPVSGASIVAGNQKRC